MLMLESFTSKLLQSREIWLNRVPICRDRRVKEVYMGCHPQLIARIGSGLEHLRGP